MKTTASNPVIRTVAVFALAALALTTAADGATYNLTAGATTVNIGGNQITMWGYGLNGGAIQVPGPVLTVPPGDTTLVINLTNNLAEGTSIVIPGLTLANHTPVTFTDGQGRTRVRSFVAEAAANGGVLTYTFNNVRPGTYLYHSGSHIAKQVQMGLYGAVTKNFAAGQAYSGRAFDNEVVLLYSEIDPAMHAAVAGGTYGTPAYPSTFNYKPAYFLVNGKPFDPAQPGLSTFAAGNPGKRVLLRMLNAGLRTHIPALANGGYMSLIAEDAYPFTAPKIQYSATVASLRTADALWSPAAAKQYALFDRGGYLTTNGAGNGGMLSYLNVTPETGAPTAVADNYTVAEDALLNVRAATGVLLNDNPKPLTATLVTPPAGTLTLAATGAFLYRSPLNFVGTDVFTYRAVSAGGVPSEVTSVRIQVTQVNDAPTAVNDSASTVINVAVSIPVSANDTDPDNDVLTPVIVAGSATGGTAVVQPDRTVLFTPTTGFTGSASFQYQARDAALTSANTATVTISVTAPPNQAPVAADDWFLTRLNRVAFFEPLRNDSDPDGTVNPASVVIIDPPTGGGAVLVNPNGSIRYTPAAGFLGTDVFTYRISDNLGLTSNLGTIRVNVVR